LRRLPAFPTPTTPFQNSIFSHFRTIVVEQNYSRFSPSHILPNFAEEADRITHERSTKEKRLHEAHILNSEL
jgi:hypothetical protein